MRGVICVTLNPSHQNRASPVACPMPETPCVSLHECNEDNLLLIIHTKPRGVTKGLKNKILSCLRGAYPTRVQEHYMSLGDGRVMFVFTVAREDETLTGLERFVINEVVNALEKHKRTSNIRACHDTEKHTGRIVFDFM